MAPSMPSSLESLPVEIKLLIFCQLDRQSDVNALKTTSIIFHVLYQHNISAIQTAIILNSLHSYGTNLRNFEFWLKAAMSSSSEICIPFLQGMKAAYKEFHKHSNSHHHHHPPAIPSASHHHAPTHSSSAVSANLARPRYRRSLIYPKTWRLEVSQEQRMFSLDWDTIIDLAIETLRRKSSSSALSGVTPEAIVRAAELLSNKDFERVL